MLMGFPENGDQKASTVRTAEKVESRVAMRPTLGIMLERATSCEDKIV